MTIWEVMQLMESLAPRAYAEDFDNTGLLVGNSEETVKGILVSLDTTEAVLRGKAHRCPHQGCRGALVPAMDSTAGTACRSQ